LDLKITTAINDVHERPVVSRGHSYDSIKRGYYPFSLHLPSRTWRRLLQGHICPARAGHLALTEFYLQIHKQNVEHVPRRSLLS
jgi:hypothetical protein